MSQFLVTVIDGTKAKFLTLEPANLPEYESGPNLIERDTLSSTAKEMSGQELWSSAKTGRNRGAAGQSHGGQSHSYDDHRQNHLIEFERRFAVAIAQKIINLLQFYQTQQLLLVAEPQILGLMREALTPILPKNIKFSELAKDISHFKPNELHGYLASKELLPAHKRV